MAAQFFRTITLATILFGSLALAYPPVSEQVDRWLYGERRSEWETPLEATRPTEAPAFTPAAEVSQTSKSADPFAWQAEMPETASNYDRSVVPAAHFAVHEEPSPRRNSTEQVRRELETCGAVGIAIEADDSQPQSPIVARCIVPISAGSRYGKPFSVMGKTSDQALEGLLHEVRVWLDRKRKS